MRGSTRLVRDREPLAGTSPAHAGVYPTIQEPTERTQNKPRACGGLPGFNRMDHQFGEQAPRMRGSTHRPVSVKQTGATSPAHAGVYPRSIVTRSSCSDKPRACGGLPFEAGIPVATAAQAPRMRGSTHPGDFVRDPWPTSPAHAGVYPGTRRRGLPPPHKPRACGGFSHGVPFGIGKCPGHGGAGT